MFTIARPFALLLALSLPLDASALSLRSEKRADGTTVLLLTNDAAPARPPQLNEDPPYKSPKKWMIYTERLWAFNNQDTM